MVIADGPSRRPTNPRWLTAAILKTVKLPYLFNRFTDFDEISHVDAHWPPTADHPLKFRLLETKMAAAAILQITKLRYLRNGLPDLYEIWYGGAKWVS